jgi:succinate dehydrogenase/fumarate reductase flavoprotein subunit
MTFNSNTVDLIVVGGGGAGLSAAIHASLGGMKVLVLEKGAQIGGTTAWSVGSFTASQTVHQQTLGIQDHPDFHFEDMALFNKGKGEVDNLELRRLFVNAAGPTLHWLMSIGVVFDGPYPESHHRHPRMHNVIPNSKSFAYHLKKECHRLGVEMLTDCKVIELIRVNERVVGVKALLGLQELKEYQSNSGVLLSAGDFAASLDLKSKFLGPDMAQAASVNQLATGDGIVLGLQNKGQVLNGRHFSALKMRFIEAPEHWIQKIPPYRLIAQGITWGLKHLPKRLIRPFVMKFITTVLGPEMTMFKSGAVMVDQTGLRIDSSSEDVAFNLVKSPGNSGFIVFDQACADKLKAWPNFISTAPGVAYAYLGDYESSRKDLFHKCSNLSDLAREIKVDEKTFRLSLQGELDMASPAFYAMGPVRSYVTITEGGLVINRNFQVLDDKSKVIEGLYAAGSNGQGGLLLEGHGHHIGWAFVSGKLAGESIVNIKGPL